MPSIKIPAPHCAARFAAATDTAALRTGTGSPRHADSAGSPATWRRSSPRSMETSRGSSDLKTTHGVRRIDACSLEVERERTGSHPETDTTAMAGVEPGNLFGHECGRSKWEQQRRGGGPARAVFLQDKRRHLERLRQVAREAAVVLARHHPVEAETKGNARLRAQFAHDCIRVEVVVRVQADRD